MDDQSVELHSLWGRDTNESMWPLLSDFFLPFLLHLTFKIPVIHMVNLKLLDGKMELNWDIENIQKHMEKLNLQSWMGSWWLKLSCKWKFRDRTYSEFRCHPEKHLACLMPNILGKKHEMSIFFLKEQHFLTHCFYFC